MLATLLGRSVSRARALLIAVTALLGGFQFLVVIVASAYFQTQGFAQLTALVPAAVQQMSGGLVFTSFLGLSAFALFHPVTVLATAEAAVFLATEPAAEIEAGLVDLVLARPVPRSTIVTRTLVLTCATTLLFVVVMVSCGRLALYGFAPRGTPWPPLRMVLTMGLNLMVVAWCFGGAAVLTATLVRRRSTALGIAGLAVVALYLLHLLAEMWSRARGLRFLTPYHYYNAPYILAGHMDRWVARDFAILIGTAALLWGIAYRVYAQRDL